MSLLVGRNDLLTSCFIVCLTAKKCDKDKLHKAVVPDKLLIGNKKKFTVIIFLVDRHTQKISQSDKRTKTKVEMILSQLAHTTFC